MWEYYSNILHNLQALSILGIIPISSRNSEVFVLLDIILYSKMKINEHFDKLLSYPTAVYTDSLLLFWFFWRVHLFGRSDVFRSKSSVSLIGQSRDNTSGSPCVVCRQTDRRTDGQQSFCIILSGNSPHYHLHSEITLLSVQSKVAYNFTGGLRWIG